MKFVIKLLILCPFTFDAVPDRYKTQEMCHKAVDDFKPALKLIPNWFVNNDIVEHLDDA